MKSSFNSDVHIENIAILCFPGLGDTILFTPCLSLLGSRFKDAQITAITMFESSTQVLEKNPNVDKVISKRLLASSTFDTAKFFLSLRGKFDLSILPFPAYRREYNIANYLLGAKYRLAHSFTTGYVSQLTFLNNIAVPVDRFAHNVQNNLNLLSALDIPNNSCQHKLDVATEEKDQEDAASILEDLNLSRNDFLIGVHPGSFGRAKEKRWSEENFGALCDMLSHKYSARILLFIGPEEVELAKRIASLCKAQLFPVINKPIRVVYHLLKSCRLLISDDSGIMHLGAAAGTKIVAIFGPTDNRLLYPWEVEHKIVRIGLTCSPCYYYDQVRSKTAPLITCTNMEKFDCIKSIQLKEVMDAISGILT